MPMLDDRRSELADAARAAFGEAPAATLMELLMPTGDAPATKADLDRLELSTDERFDRVDERFDRVDGRLDAHDARFDSIDKTLVSMDKRLDVQHHELIAIFRGELNQAMTSQIRAVVGGVLTAVVSIAVLSLTFAQILA